MKADPSIIMFFKWILFQVVIRRCVLSDRIVVMREGQVTGILDNKSSQQKVTPEDIMRYATSDQSLEEPLVTPKSFQ